MSSDTPGAEAIAPMAPDALLFKDFNQTGFENMEKSMTFAAKPAMFIATDDTGTKPLVLELGAAAGFDAVDAGRLRSLAFTLHAELAPRGVHAARVTGAGADRAETRVRSRCHRRDRLAAGRRQAGQFQA